MESVTYREAVELGEKTGETRGEKMTILKVLKGKFGEIPQEIKDKLSEVSSVENLDVLAEKVGAVRSLKDFKKALTEVIKRLR